MSDTTKETLESLERLLVADLASPKRVLEAAYTMGKIDGGLEMAKVGENITRELHALVKAA